MKPDLSTSIPLSDESTENFSFKNVAVRIWLVLVLASTSAIALLFPPGFWVCGVGFALLAIGILSNSARTSQWMSWQNEGSLSWFEGWSVSTATLLIVVPLAAVLVRSQLS